MLMPCRDRDAEPCGAYFAALSKRLNSTCSISTMSRFEQWQTAFEIDFDRVVFQDLIRPLQGRADDVGEIGGSGVRLSGPDSSLVMSRRLPINRLSRSASSRMVRMRLA